MNPPPPASHLERHNRRVAQIIHAADVETFLRRELGEDDPEGLHW